MSAGPDVTVEIAFDSGYSTPAADRTWTDVSEYVNAESNVEITRGRQDELSQSQPSTLKLTLDNTDGRFTAGLASSPYFPNVKRGRPIRVRATWDGTTHDRFVGYINDWPTEWAEGVSAISTATVTASSRMARIALGSELRSIVEEEILADNPAAYYPLGEPEGSTVVFDVSGNANRGLTMVGEGADVVFGNATGPGTDDLTAATFAAGKYLARTGQPWVAAGETDVVLRCSFLTSATSTQQFMVTLWGSPYRIFLGIDALDRLNAQWGLTSAIVSVNSTGTVNDGETHDAEFRLNVSGGTYTASLFLDGVEVDTATGATAVTIGDMSALYVGSSFDGNGGFTGTLAHAALFTSSVSDARIADHAEAALTGFVGDSSDERIARLAMYAGIPTAEQSLEAGSSTDLVLQLTNGKSVLDLMREVEATESGVLFDGKDGDLTFHARSHRYNVASSFTLDVDAGEVEAGLTSKLDDQYLQNDVSATVADGPSSRAVDTTSIDDYGSYRTTLSLLTVDEDELADACAWRVFLYAEPAPRMPSVDADVLNLQAETALVTSLLSADIGTRFTLDNLPTQAPSSSLDQFVEGITETIGPEFYLIGFNTSPVTGLDVWTVGDAVFGQYDAYPLAY